MGNNQFYVWIVLLDLHELLQIRAIAQSLPTRDMQHDNPAALVQDLQLVTRQEVVDLYVILGDLRIGSGQINLGSQKMTRSDFLFQLGCTPCRVREDQCRYATIFRTLAHVPVAGLQVVFR